jgi:hypothetical protein
MYPDFKGRQINGREFGSTDLLGGNFPGFSWRLTCVIAALKRFHRRVTVRQVVRQMSGSPGQKVHNRDNAAIGGDPSL